jgi:hypothetical protein
MNSNYFKNSKTHIDSDNFQREASFRTYHLTKTK